MSRVLKIEITNEGIKVDDSDNPTLDISFVTSRGIDELVASIDRLVASSKSAEDVK